MNGRFFAGTQVIAYIASGQERFSKSSSNKTDIDEDETEGADGEAQDSRDRFGQWLKEGEQEATVDEN